MTSGILPVNLFPWSDLERKVTIHAFYTIQGYKMTKTNLPGSDIRY